MKKKITEKMCKGCNTVFPIDDFAFRPNGRGGHKRRSRCRKCDATYAKERRSTWTEEDKVKRKELARIYNEANNEKIRRHGRRAGWRKMGLNPDSIEKYISLHDGKCDICKSGFLEVGVLRVDHCHKTGKFRGLICNSCNLGLGKFFDMPEILASAADYLMRGDILLPEPDKKESKIIDLTDEPVVYKKGSETSWSKLTEEKVVKIKLLLSEGKGLSEIARMFGVTHSAIYYIRTGKHWKHVK